MRRFLVVTLCFCVLEVSSRRYIDPQYTNFIRDWSASCLEQTLPDYHWKELAPATRKCDTERCVFLIYDYISKYLPAYFTSYDICFEKNTKMAKTTYE